MSATNIVLVYCANIMFYSCCNVKDLVTVIGTQYFRDKDNKRVPNGLLFELRDSVLEITTAINIRRCNDNI